MGKHLWPPAYVLAGLLLPTSGLILGCYHRSSLPAPSANALLASLSVQGASTDVAPIFDQATYAYTLPTSYGGSVGPVTVKATLADSNATMTLNGATLASGMASSPIPLKVGTNTLNLVVTAQDRSTTKTYTITQVTNAPTTAVQVLDSINGTPVPGATITLTDAADKVLQSGIPVDASGKVSLGLDGSSRYNISAQAPGTAQSRYAKFDASRETQATLYCHPLGMTNFPAQAPQITALAVGKDGKAWNPVAGSSVADTLANLAYLKISAVGVSGIVPTAWSGFGLAMNVDAPMSFLGGYLPYATEESAVPVTSGATTLYRTTVNFKLPLTNYKPQSSHFLDFVAYDSANNRTEQRLYLTITDGAPDTSQPDLSALAPTNLDVFMNTYGLSEELFDISPGGVTPGTHTTQISFSYTDEDGNTRAITGFEVERSLDGATWTRVGSRSFSAPREFFGYSWYDVDASLQVGTPYYYRVRAFNGNTTNNGGFSPYSTPMASALLPPFQVNLAAPASASVTSSLTPKLSFTISNPAPFDPAISDFMYFLLRVSEVTGSEGTFGQPFRYNFAAGRFETIVFDNGIGVWGDASAQVSVDAAHTTFTIQMPPGYLQPGITYQWTIYGDRNLLTGQLGPCKFEKFTYPFGDRNSQTYGHAVSSGSNYTHSYGAINGSFILTVDPSAQ